MFKELKKRVKNEKGLTLIELLAVIVILAIIAAIAIPAIGNIINNSRDKAILSEALNIMSGAKIAHMDGECSENICIAEQIQPYIDGVTLHEDTVVSLDGDDWKIIYPEFENITTGSKYNLVDSITDTSTTPNTDAYTETTIKMKLDSGN